MLRGYERAYAERDKTPSSAYVQDYIDNYLTGEPSPGIEYEYKLVQQLVPTITLPDVNKLASNWITDDNRVIVAESPKKDSVTIPTPAELLAVFDRAAKTKVTAYTENLSAAALVPHPPAAGTIVKETQIADVGVSDWTLSNGVRVLVKPTDFKDDEVLFGAYAFGGTSLASNPDYMSASLASQVIARGGLGDFSAIDLQKKLTGKVASVSASIGGTSEGLGGRASPKDLETLFQLIYLHFTAPRLDTAAWHAFGNQVAPYLANRGVDPDEVFSDTVSWTMSQHDFRARPLSPAVFAEVDPQKALTFYKDRFSDAGAFTFVFVGNVDTASLKPLVATYLASLPSTHRGETFKVVDNGAPTGVIDKLVRKGVEPKANTIIDFTGACDYSPQTRFQMEAMVELFQIKLNETLREQLGGTYSPSVAGSCSKVPRQRYSLEVQFNSAPDNVEKLTKSVFALIDTLQTQGPQPADVDKVREQIVRSREVSLKQNGYWLATIMTREETGEDLPSALGAYDAMVKNLTAAQIQDAAKRYFNTQNYARFVLLPQASKPTP